MNREYISEEILYYYGFYKDSDGCLCLDWPGSTIKFYWIGIIQLAIGFAPLMNLRHIVYVDQLKNLYESLTGNELEFKETWKKNTKEI